MIVFWYCVRSILFYLRRSSRNNYWFRSIKLFSHIQKTSKEQLTWNMKYRVISCRIRESSINQVKIRTAEKYEKFFISDDILCYALHPPFCCILCRISAPGILRFAVFPAKPAYLWKRLKTLCSSQHANIEAGDRIPGSNLSLRFYPAEEFSF